MSYTIQALPASYAGQVFRSRLEARVAYYFDLLEIGWDYEPEGFALPSRNYCPDFLCKPHKNSKGFYVEVRPDFTSWDDTKLTLAELCAATQQDVYLIAGFPVIYRPRSDDYDAIASNALGFYYEKEESGPRRFEWVEEGVGYGGRRAFWFLPHVRSACESIFCHYAFVRKGWGVPYFGDSFFGDTDDFDCIEKARRLRFDRTGRAIL